MSKKRVVITGASDGIGRELAMRLADEYELVLCGRDEERLREVSKKCHGAEYYTFDLNEATGRKQAATQICKSRVDILINNAGVWHKMGQLETLEDQLIEEVLSTNLTSQIILTKHLLPALRASNGIVINVISKSGITAQEGQTVYSASKWGMRGFTDVLRNDLKEEGVRVGAVYQSGTNTRLFEKAGEDFSAASFSDPKDIADAVAYMISRPQGMWINEVRIER